MLVQVSSLIKEFKIFNSEKTITGTIKSLLFPKFRIAKALDNVSFNIAQGELIGFVGPNGAGKSTTIKILSGILYPSSGHVLVDGLIPHQNRTKNAFNIGVVFGQRSQLYWDLPIIDSFDIFKQIYKIENKTFKKNVDFFVEYLGMKDFINKPVRQLSLGQKMRGNIAVSLLHEPKLLYLDEPTIGLDVLAKDKIRKFILEINKEKKTTVILTTHDLDDIEEICNRLLMIDKGKIIYDGSLNGFKAKFSDGYIIYVDYQSKSDNSLDERLKIIKSEGSKIWFQFDAKELSVSEAIKKILNNYEVNDLSINEQDIEEVVRKIYYKS